MSTDTVTIAGHTYVSPSALSFGDYGGSGSVGRSNIDCLVDEYGGAVFPTSYQAVRWASEGITSGRDEEELIAAVSADPPPKALRCEGSWGSDTLYLHAELCNDVLARLEHYALLDEMRCSDVEMEWEREAWDCWLKSDLVSTLPEDLEDRAGELTDEQLFEAYRAAMDAANEYPTPEDSGVHVNVKRIAGAFLNQIERLLNIVEPAVIEDPRQGALPDA